MNNMDMLSVKECFTPTLNKMGYMALALDEYNCSFIKYCAVHPKGRYLDIGCAFGITTLPVLKLGCEITACDIDHRHLIILERNASFYRKNLSLVAGHLPDSLIFSKASFNAINLSMVLHFLPGKKIVVALRQLFEWLKPGGYVYVTTSSPYQGTLKNFIPIYEQNINNNEIWPGTILDIHKYIPQRAKDLPKFNHVFTPVVLKKKFEDTGFIVQQADFFTRDNIPKDITYDGREYTGLIAFKP